MSISSPSANKHLSAKNLEIYPQVPAKKKSIELIKEFLLSQPEQIKKIENVSKTIYETINTFIEITQNYSTQLEILALKIIPNYTTEGQLAQAVQGILLFYSEGLNNLVLDLKNENIQIKEDALNNILNKFNKYKVTYFEKIKEAIKCSEQSKKEILSYQEYLVNKEYNEFMKNGDFKKKDDVIIIKKENNTKEIKIKKENNDNINDIKESINSNNSNSYENEIDNYPDYDPIEDIELNNFDNEKDVIESHKCFMSKIDEINNYYGEIKDFLSKEKTNLRKNLFNICDHLIEGLLKCAKIQEENYNIQNDVIKKLTNKLKYEEKDDNKIRPAPYRLKYLEIYNDYIQEKNDLNINNTNNNNNKKSHLTTDDLDVKKKKISNMPRESYNMGLPSIRLDSLSRNTISFNQNNNNKLIKELKLKKLKSLVIKLNRAEILKIFNKIKNTKINISESDYKLIEQETNYQTIFGILVLIFIDTDKYKEQDKNILIDFFEKDKIYISYFIKILNDHRTKGNFIISGNTLQHLGELFKIINNLILSKNDMELFKYIFILSMTYYCISEENNMKIYVFSYIKDHPDYQKVKFWDDYLHELIEHDLKGNSHNINLAEKKLDELNKEEREKLSNCYFSNFLTVVKAMADFRMDKNFLKNFVEKNKEKYILSKEQIENIGMIFDISVNDNEVNYIGDFHNKENRKESNDKNIQNKEKEEIKENKENKEKESKEKENKETKEKEERSVKEVKKEDKEIKDNKIEESKEKEEKEENNKIKEIKDSREKDEKKENKEKDINNIKNDEKIFEENEKNLKKIEEEKEKPNVEMNNNNNVEEKNIEKDINKNNISIEKNVDLENENNQTNN